MQCRQLRLVIYFITEPLGKDLIYAMFLVGSISDLAHSLRSLPRSRIHS